MESLRTVFIVLAVLYVIKGLQVMVEISSLPRIDRPNPILIVLVGTFWPLLALFHIVVSG